MNILITGGAGFIGSHLAELLLDKGYFVTVFDNLSTGSRTNIEHLEKNPCFRFLQGDVRDPEAVKQAMESFPSTYNCNRVYHLAAAVGVKLIMEHPLESLETNLKGTEVVLKASKRYGAKFLLTSTSEIYGKNTNIPLTEDSDRILGSASKDRWSYSSAKAVDEILTNYYWRDYNHPTVVVRLFNTTGPRQTGFYGMVVPRFVKKAMNNEPIEIYGTGDQTRCFTHVKDVVRALYDLMETDASNGETFNIGSTNEISITHLAKTIIRQLGSSSELKYISYEEVYGDKFEDMLRRVPCVEKLHRTISFKPQLKLSNIISDIETHLRANNYE